MTYPISTEHPTTIRIEPALKQQLHGYARSQGASLSWLICDILRKWVEWRKQQDARKK